MRHRNSTQTPKYLGESFPAYVERVETTTGKNHKEAQVLAFDEYSVAMLKPTMTTLDVRQPTVNLLDYLGDWACLAYADAWFQAFGYDAVAHYYEKKSDEEFNKAMTMQAQLLNMTPKHLRFHVDNEQKMHLIPVPVHARARAETLNDTHTRIKVDFGFGADPRGNYLIIGYKPKTYAVIGDFDYQYLWFLVPKQKNAAMYSSFYQRHLREMIDIAKKFGYSDEFIGRMNYRAEDGHYEKYPNVMSDPTYE